MPMFRDLLLYLNDDGHQQAHVASAAALAERLGARLTGLAVSEPLAAHAEYLPPEALDRYQAAWRTRNARLAETFTEQTSRFDLVSEWRAVEDLRMDRRTVDVIALQARYADLLVIGQVDPDRPADLVPADLPGQAAVMAGRPVLALPYIEPQRPIGQRVVVAWDGERESTRALADALPLLVAAEQVQVVMVGEPAGPSDAEGSSPSAEIAAHLERHGISAQVVNRVSSEGSIADALLASVADADADLLVMGAYGGSRFRELVLGGTTRRILSEMTVPVLLSH